jgi:D-alanine-D-alanine ligase-like ATP-grasp enzyme
LGVDFVLDRDRGPLMLELNARPGLAIQVANLVGLRPRLEQADDVAGRLQTNEERVVYAMQTFGA